MFCRRSLIGVFSALAFSGDRTVKSAKNDKKASLLGLGLDSDDGQARISRGKNFVLLGGSEETHAVMQETALKVNEKLDSRRKSLDELSPNEFRDIIGEVSDSIGTKK